ncbi:hypothetical protein [Nonomuraea gerenzanensis]|uniref:FXSXX-COOH protein n=1 Tax=Nonomuraea gerenzanensis TaxID=93944 RepID=A0A1M4ECV4_9ACTN|nr:hypothetical protein [Nonomuraea gerenzanensis]UBU18570.1 hypothetical protein LCN96_27175 [Nonomuraea gerenzanensis]SBO96413.1 hypothetical protein BN4615_P5929 [Nonomuraea gerenzanensis]
MPKPIGGIESPILELADMTVDRLRSVDDAHLVAAVRHLLTSCGDGPLQLWQSDGRDDTATE